MNWFGLIFFWLGAILIAVLAVAVAVIFIQNRSESRLNDDDYATVLKLQTDLTSGFALLLAGMFLRMTAALAMAVRDIAINSYRR